jgi:hypothetical protein
MKRRTTPPQNLDLFEFPQRPAPLPGSMDYRAVVSELVGNMLGIAHSLGLDRHEVAMRASRLTGRDITKNMLDGYTSPAREEFNVPFWVAPVLEHVCSSTILGNWYAGVHGGKMLLGAEALDAEIGRLTREKEQASRQLRDLTDLRRRLR